MLFRCILLSLVLAVVSFAVNGSGSRQGYSMSSTDYQMDGLDSYMFTTFGSDWTQRLKAGDQEVMQAMLKYCGD